MNENEILEVHAAIYDEVETYPNFSVQILRNTVTGDVSIGWWENEEGEESC